ncbi:cAMP-dependent protein kinase catalytic subunit alpha-like [Athalia rosae]|uniref:cAMP-dependent protein kinase catalytic subunit alpha-like n=1 Tax=Athalia rosae TaxID=37344 RepID=UPI0020338C20|nr:cAMP-dependent protein kinase catalytic subunit alpha-like [Athalia rosae]
MQLHVKTSNCKIFETNATHFNRHTFYSINQFELVMDDREQEKAFKEYDQILDGLRADFNESWKTKKREALTLDDFVRYRTLGTGAFGRVMLVKQKSNGVYYAMKILEKAKLIKLKQVEHTGNEKRILQSVKFPFVIYMEFCFKDNSYLYLILPFISGGEMFSHLRRMGKFDEGLARFYGAQVTLALEYLHHCGLVYRDLKPENILIEKNGYLKITDFGFCKLVEGRTWTLCGTPEYLAPEIILSKGYGKSVDWWSFGVLIYEMNAGYPPFYARDPMKIYEKIVSGKYKFANNFGEDLRDLLRNVLQVDLSRRYGNLKDGPADIKKHRWFRSIDWLKIYYQTIEPSFIPKRGNVGDSSNYDQYDEEELIVDKVDRYAKEFADF